MSESTFIKECQRILKPFGIINRIENNVGSGFPDAVYTLKNKFHPTLDGVGYIEFKVKKSWPARDKTIFKLRHFKNAQKTFMKRNGKLTPNRCWMFLKVEKDKDYLLFGHENIMKIGTVNSLATIDCARKCWHSRLDAYELMKVLTS